jgi:hypothetical protein
MRSLSSRLQKVNARLQEARVAGKAAGTLADFVASRYAKLEDIVGRDLYRQLDEGAKRVDRLNIAIDKATVIAAKGTKAADQRALKAMERERDAAIRRLGIAADSAEKKALAAQATAAKQTHANMETMRQAAASAEQTAQRAIGAVSKAADQQLAALERASDNVYHLKAKTLQPMADVGHAANAALRKANVRAVILRQHGEQFERYIAAKEKFDAAYDAAYQQILRAYEREHVGAIKAPPGYKLESGLEQGSPSGTYKALDPVMYDFLAQNPHPGFKLDDKDANMIFRSIGLLNTLSRASIVINPLVHGVSNLGMAFLAMGGDPAQLVAILMNRAQFSPQIEREAVQAGAVADATVRLFGDEGAHTRYTPSGQLAQETSEKLGGGAVGKVAGAARRAQLHVARDMTIPRRVPVVGGKNVSYEAFQNWLFDKVERNMRLDRFQAARRAGLSPGEAAREVNAWAGRVGDLSQAETKIMMMQNLFYFYPWMKTVVPFWIKTGLLSPKWWTAPVRAIQVGNEQQGFDDPSRPFTMTAGHRPDGEWRRIVVPAPQRVLEAAASGVRLPIDLGRAMLGHNKAAWASVREDAAAPINFLAEHASMPLSVLKDTFELAANQGRSNLSPFNVYKNPANWARILAPVENLLRARQDPAGAAATFPFGGFDYGQKTGAQDKYDEVLNRVSGLGLGKTISALRAQGSPESVEFADRLEEYRDAAKAIILDVHHKYEPQIAAAQAAGDQAKVYALAQQLATEQGEQIKALGPMPRMAARTP